MSDDDFAFEPIPGLPEHLPEGERILWQGAPGWRGLVTHVLHLKKLLGLGALALILTVFGGLMAGSTMAAILPLTTFLVLMTLAWAVFAVGIARWMARSTVYTITNRRVVMRFGLALPMTFNLPFQSIETAAVKVYGDGSGDIPLTLKGNDRIAWLHLWPHTRPWQLKQPMPMLRDLQDVRQVTGILSDALAKALPHGRKVETASVSGGRPTTDGKLPARDALATA